MMDVRGLNEELSPLQNQQAKQKVGVVAIDLSYEVSLTAAEWLLENHLRKQDLLILLGILKDTNNHFLKHNCDFNGASDESFADKGSWMDSELKKSGSLLQARCLEKGIGLKIQVKVGNVKSILEEEVMYTGATMLVLDRHFKLKEDRCCLESQLSCKVYQMRDDKERYKRLQHQGSEGDISSGEEAEGSSMSLDLDSGYYAINLEDSISQAGDIQSMPQAVSNVGRLTENQPSGLRRPESLAIAKSPAFWAASSPVDFPSKSAGMTRSSFVASSFPLASMLSADMSSPEAQTSISYSLSRSASDSSFQTYDADSLIENPLYEQFKHKLGMPHFSRQLSNQYQGKERKAMKDYDLSLDLLNHSDDDQKEKTPLERPSSVFERETEQNSEKITALLMSKSSTFSVKQSELLQNHPSKSYIQKRSLLCSICKQMTPSFHNTPTRLSFAEVGAATDNFSQTNFLAEGGFGSVYKGMLNGQAIAVKQHKLASTQGYKEFRSEVELLSCAQHRNLVMLLGYCDENGHRILVYEYVCNKSLDWHLSPKSPTCLEWYARQKIAVGSARALRYLHEECRVGCIIHRDMRPNNILLTHEFEPMVGDFGLARSHSEGEDTIETRIIGTFGYLAPEYAESGQVSWKTDVYAFGVVLLELITGRKAIDLLRPPGEQSLTEWARTRHFNDTNFSELVDSRLGNSYNGGEMLSMVRAAYHCIKKDPLQRPRMSQVLYILEGDNKDMDESTRGVMLPSATKASVSRSSRIGKMLQLQLATKGLNTALTDRSRVRKSQPGNSNTRKARLQYENML